VSASSLRQSCILQAGGSSQEVELCIAQNELKQGLLLNRNFVAVNALGIKDEWGTNENVPAEII
jgi:hypothetical protein